MSNRWTKDPEETLQYMFDWAPLRNGRGDTDWLDSSVSPVEVISGHVISTESPGLIITGDSITDNGSSVTLKASGGVAGNTYDVTCTITTSLGQVAERTAKIKVFNR